MKLTKIKLGALRPNPHRNMANYPLSAEKIDALRESMRETGIWPNIIVRAFDDAYQIAYGHHRMAAAIAEFGEDYKIAVVVDDIDDLGMLRLMARENLETYVTEFRALLETWEAAVIAASQGLFGEDARKKPSQPAVYLASHDSKFSYSVDHVAKVIGWTYTVNKGATIRANNAATASAAALELITTGHMERDDFNGMTARDAMNLTVTAREKMRQIAEATDRHVKWPNIEPERREAIKKEAKKQIARVGMIARHVAKDTVEGRVPAAHVRTEVTGRIFSNKEAREVLADEYIKHTTNRVSRFFDVDSDTGKRFVAIIDEMPNLNEAERHEVEKLELALNHMSETAKSTSRRFAKARTSPANIHNLKTIEGGRHE